MVAQGGTTIKSTIVFNQLLSWNYQERGNVGFISSSINIITHSFLKTDNFKKSPYFYK